MAQYWQVGGGKLGHSTITTDCVLRLTQHNCHTKANIWKPLTMGRATAAPSMQLANRSPQVHSKFAVLHLKTAGPKRQFRLELSVASLHPPPLRALMLPSALPRRAGRGSLGHCHPRAGAAGAAAAPPLHELGGAPALSTALDTAAHRCACSAARFAFRHAAQ